MDTSTTTSVESATVKLGDLAELLNGAITHASIDKSLPALNAVLLSSVDGQLIASATDRYRLISGSITAEGESFTPILVSVADIKRVLALLKGEGARMDTLPVTISYAGDMVSVSVRGNAVTVSLVVGQFPPIEHLFNGEKLAQDSASFNPAFFADYAKIAGKGKPVTVEFTGANKPMNIVMRGNAVTWRALLMPMRIPA